MMVRIVPSADRPVVDERSVEAINTAGVGP
jgi:hypothetical protein